MMIDVKKLQEGLRQCLFGACVKCPYNNPYCLKELDKDFTKLFEILPATVFDAHPKDSFADRCCPDCHYTSLPGFRFCPHCGKELT